MRSQRRVSFNIPILCRYCVLTSYLLVLNILYALKKMVNILISPRLQRVSIEFNHLKNKSYVSFSARFCNTVLTVTTLPQAGKTNLTSSILIKRPRLSIFLND